MMYRNSLPTPFPACRVLNLYKVCKPTNQPRNDTDMNRAIFTLRSGTPTARAEAWLPPTAKIQLPIRVRCRIQPDKATNANHHSTVTSMVTEPTLKLEEKIACRML